MLVEDKSWIKPSSGNDIDVVYHGAMRDSGRVTGYSSLIGLNRIGKELPNVSVILAA